MTTRAGTTKFLEHNPHGFSEVVEVSGGRMVYITGQMALNPSGELVGEGDYRAQIEQAFLNVTSQLAVVGATFEHVVKLTLLADQGITDHLYDYAEIRDRHVNTANPPASAIVLAPKLVHPGALVDIAVIAHLP